MWSLKAAALLAAASACGAFAVPAAAQDVGVEFEGNRVFTSERLRVVTTDCLARRGRVEEKFIPEALDYCLRKDVVNFMRRAGYLRAAVGEPRPAPHAEGLSVSVPVEEHELYRLGRIKIEGASHFNAKALRELLPLRRGDIADATAVVRWLGEHLKRKYEDEGFIQYEYDIEPEFRLEPGARAGVVDFSVTLNEGRQFRLRRLEFKADGYVPEDALREALGLREGEVFRRQGYRDGINNLNGLDLFEPRGRFEAVDGEGDVEFHAGEETGELDITIHLTERGQGRAARRTTRPGTDEGEGRPGRPTLVRRP